MIPEIAIAGGAVLLVGYKLVKLLSRKKYKGKLKKCLIKSLKNLDVSDLRKTIVALQDYDSKYSTHKLEKYLETAFQEYNGELPINENVLKELPFDLRLIDNLFDEEEEEINENVDLLDNKLKEIAAKRKEVIIRRNELRGERRGKKTKNRRTQGKLG